MKETRELLKRLNLSWYSDSLSDTKLKNEIRNRSVFNGETYTLQIKTEDFGVQEYSWDDDFTPINF